MPYPAFPADPSGNIVPVLPVKYDTVLEAVLPQTAVAFGGTTERMVRVWALGCDMYYVWGASGVAAPSATFGALVKDGNFFDVPVTAAQTHFRAVARSGSGSYRLELLG